MTIALKANAAGTQGEILLNGNTVAEFLADAVNFPGLAQSLASNGYVKLPGGLIIQWGQMSNNNSQGNGISTIAYPIPWPNAILNIQVSAYSATPNGDFKSAKVPFGGMQPTYTLVNWYGANNALTTEQLAGSWIAIGY